MKRKLETIYTPADFEVLKARDLNATACVVFDVLRATSSMITALGHGAAGILPVAEIPEAIAAAEQNPGALLAGERDGLRIGADQTGGRAFDLGNSPREFTRERVAGKWIAMTTTNGTRALRSCAHARLVLASSFLNLEATACYLRRENPENLLIICSGTFEESAYEDVLAAGALCDALWNDFAQGAVSDGALMAHKLYTSVKDDLVGALAQARNGRRLLSRPELAEDVPYSARLNAFDLVAAMGKDGRIRKLA